MPLTNPGDASLDGPSNALDTRNPIRSLLQLGEGGVGGGEGGEGGEGAASILPLASPRSSSPSSSSGSLPGDGGGSSTRAVARPSPRAGVPAAAAAATATATAGTTIGSAPAGTAVLLHEAQAEAARKALALNLKLQNVLREELKGVDETLRRNREILKAAEARLTSKRCVGFTTSSEKFRWSRGVGKFLQVQAHPGKRGLYKEQEMLLRRDLSQWQSEDTKALSNCIAAKYPDAVKSQTAVEALQKIDWEEISRSVVDAIRRNLKRDRSRRTRTAEECRLRWTHVGMLGIVADATWSKEEDLAIIMQAEERGGREWVKIAEEVQKVHGGAKRRIPIACLRRFQCALNTKFVRWSKWSKKEDQMLHDAVKRHGPRSWLRVARDVPGRSPVQCEGRYRLGGNTAPPPPPQLLHLQQQQQQRRSSFKQESSLLPEEQDGDYGGGGDGHDAPSFLLESKFFHHPESKSSGYPQATARNGCWTLDEERLLSLAVRAHMPPKKTGKSPQPPPPPSRGAEKPGAAAAAAAAQGGARTGRDEGKGKKRRRDSSEETASASAAASKQPGGRAPPPPPGGGPRVPKGEAIQNESGGTNALEGLAEVDWSEVAKLMFNTRSEHQCREKWFEVLDPSVNRLRAWEPEEDAQLRKVMERRNIGEWRAVERDMAEWAHGRQILRRTDISCRRRYKNLEPEKYERYATNERDRREVEPRINAPSFATHVGRTEVTFEDFDLVDVSFSGDGEGEDDDDNYDDDDDDDDDQGW
ncbi:unnamed protein product [Pylaiella littoralis]